MANRTQLDDLKDKLKDAEYNIQYCIWKDIKGSPIHKYFVEKASEYRTIINNIK